MKALKVALSVLLTTLLFSQTVYAYNPKTDVKYNDYSPIYIESSLDNMDNTANSMVDYVLNVTPGDIWELFTQEGVNIYITQSVPSDARQSDSGHKYDGRCYGATFSYNGSNKITKVSSPVCIYIYSNALRADSYHHECGHALDDIAEYITGYYQGSHPISNSAEWQNLYATYGNTMAAFDGNASVNMYNAAEAFAEAYRLYFTYPGQLQSRCPEVYNFVGSQIAKYTAYVPPLTYDNFNYLAYALQYQDVFNAYGLDKKALWDHYVNCGKAEGRKAYRVVKVKR